MSELLDERAQERTIGGVNYKARPIAFGVGLKALNRLIKVLAPLASAALREGRPFEKAAAVIELLPQNLTDDDLDYFRAVFGAGAWYEEGDAWIPLVRITGKSANATDHQELHFAGRYREFLEWLVFCVEVNYGGFFDGVVSEATGEGEASKPKPGGLFATLAQTLAGRAPAPSTSTPGNGSSGGS